MTSRKPSPFRANSLSSIGRSRWSLFIRVLKFVQNNTMGAFTNNLTTAITGCFKQVIIFNHTTQLLETGLFQFQITCKTFLDISNCRCLTVCAACRLKCFIGFDIQHGSVADIDTTQSTIQYVFEKENKIQILGNAHCTTTSQNQFTSTAAGPRV